VTGVGEFSIKMTSSVLKAQESSAADAGLSLERANIDSAASRPVMAFFGTAVVWLVIASLLGFIASVKLVQPGFLADYSFLTYGRIVPAFQASLIYGWASLVGMGVGIWLMSRLCKVQVKYPGILIFGLSIWNVGLLLGVVSILGGKSTGVEGMEIPRGIAAIMLLGYAIIGMWPCLIYRARRDVPAYISVWYLAAAFFWFPLLFGFSYLFSSMPEIRGVMHDVVAAWFNQGLLLLWITALGIAAAYYLIPKVINKPIYSYNIASLGFWTFVLFGGFTAMVRLSGGPIPAWLVTLSVSASILMLVPVATVLANMVMTLRGKTIMVAYSPTVRFTAFGVAGFGLASFLAFLSGFRGFDKIVHFTMFGPGCRMLVIYSFFSMVMFGSIYYIVPRLVGREWCSVGLIQAHFWGSAYAGSVAILLLVFAGISSGVALSDPAASFWQASQIGQLYYVGHSVAMFFLVLTHLIFAFHFGLMLFRLGRPPGRPAVFGVNEQEKGL
jgi:cytochrome c oxidase cbb3-type subunit 1